MKFNLQEEQLIIKPYKSQTDVYVREQHGFYQKIRRSLNWCLILLFIAMPYVQYNNQQAVLLDVVKQEFRIFNMTFWPQDFILLAGIFIVAAFALFFVTTWLGRVWCGYACPQTVWTLLFVWVEHRIEGTRNQRMALDKAPWTLTKATKKTIKHLIWQLMSIFTATTFLSYFVPFSELYSTMLTLEWSRAVTLWVLLFAISTYINAGWMREHVCIHLCPYSRFQSAMFDKNTSMVSYDAKRGENRGPRKRKDDIKETALGDCVDCNLCVDVCPAGIDIRNGMQYECINCGLCIDACDQTMEKFNYPKGLISYSNESQQAGKQAKRFDLKLSAYGALTLVSILLLALWIENRVPLDVSIIRDRTALYRVNFEGIVENTYTLKILNKTQVALHFNIDVKGLNVPDIRLPKQRLVAPGIMQEIPITLAIDGELLARKKTEFSFIIQSIEQPDMLIEQSTSFFTD